MQLKLGDNELKRLSARVEEDYNSDLAGHDLRIERFRRYYQRWRNRVDPPAAGEEDEPNFSVPLIQWNVLHKWADQVSKLVGADAEIVAKAIGPADQRLVRKVGLYETWRIFSAMRLLNPFITFTFRQILFGRAHAYRPWVRDAYPVRDPESGNVVERLAYQGPGFYPLWPDQLIVPAERNVESIHDFSHCIRRYRVRPNDLLRGEELGLYQGISDRYDELVKASKLGQQRERGEEIQEEKDSAEGVISSGMTTSSESLTVLEWYGWHRKLRRRKDAREDNLKERERWESELVIRVIPEMSYAVIGVQDLMDIYPTMRHRRPFSECSLIKDGSYWSPGFGELLESIEDEKTTNHRLFTKGGMFTVGPVIFYRPSSGFDPDKFRYSPGDCIPTEDPAGVKVVSLQGDLRYSMAQDQIQDSIAERITGNTDFSMGRQPDRANQPRTARGTLALLEQGNIRASLDSTVLREDMGIIVSDLFELEQQFPISAETFFRVTEEQAGGLFPVKNGGSTIQPDELGGRYDFDLKFATSVWSKEAEREKQLALYPLDMQNPLIASNPRALWQITNRVHKAMGDDNFADVLPEPPDLVLPRTAREEWVLALQGEPIEVHPDDHDLLHVREHVGQIRDQQASERRDEPAIAAMTKHIEEHQAQHSQKLMRQALTNQLVQTMAQNATSGQGLQLGGQPMNLQRLQQFLGEMPGGEPGAAGGPPGPGAAPAAPGPGEGMPPMGPE